MTHQLQNTLENNLGKNIVEFYDTCIPDFTLKLSNWEGDKNNKAIQQHAGQAYLPIYIIGQLNILNSQQGASLTCRDLFMECKVILSLTFSCMDFDLVCQNVFPRWFMKQRNCKQHTHIHTHT